MKKRGRRKNENIVKIQQSGKKGSYRVTIPIHIMRELRWREHQRVVVNLDKKTKTVKIKDWPVRP